MSSKEVELTGGAPWGFRMHGGADQNQPLRISRVNPGRKASLSGIREGDVISSINGRPTKGITNADAHGLLRTAGPVLKLGLNEDREMSPRRRSNGKGSELKRPSQLIADFNGERAMPQAPVYATIRASPSSQYKPPPPGLRSSLNSLPSALSSTPLVKSVGAPEEPIRIHPTNPFYTTLPTNQHSSPSKLPVPNSRASYSSLDRTKSMTNSRGQEEFQNDFVNGLKSPSYFSRIDNTETSSLPYDSFSNRSPNHQTNGYTNNIKVTANDEKSDPFSYDSLFSQNISNGLPSRSNDELSDPFDTSRINSDLFKKYLPSNNEQGSKSLTNSLSDNSFHTKEIKRSTITEHKINEIKEVKTIKKVVLNGSGDHTSSRHEIDISMKPKNSEFRRYGPDKYNVKSPFTPTEEYFYSSKDHNNYDRNNSASSYYSPPDDHRPMTPKLSDSSATESDDSADSGQEKTVSGNRTRKYTDPKRRTINKVSKKILKAIEKLTCNMRTKKTKKVAEPKPLKNSEIPKNNVSSKPPLKSPTTPTAPALTTPTAKREFPTLHSSLL